MSVRVNECQAPFPSERYSLIFMSDLFEIYHKNLCLQGKNNIINKSRPHLPQTFGIIQSMKNIKNNFKLLLLAIGVVAVWRGAWGLMDLYLFPG